MSLAWTTIVVLVLLLPGFLFFVGLQSAERFARDSATNPLAQLAGIVFVALVFHGAYLAVVDPLLCRNPWYQLLPCVDLQKFFLALRLEGQRDGAEALVKEVSRNLHEYRSYILAYVILLPWVALRVGMRCGRFIVEGKSKWLRRVPTKRLKQWVNKRAEKQREVGIRLFWKHRWTYDLTIEKRNGNPLLAFVLTKIRQGERVLIYRGFLKEFFVDPDGRISYLVLRGVSRYYLLLQDKQVATSQRDDWTWIRSADGTRSPAPVGHDDRKTSISGDQTDDDESYMVIHGEQIENVVFDRLQVTEHGMADLLDELKEKLREALQEGLARAVEQRDMPVRSPAPPSTSAAAPTTDSDRLTVPGAPRTPDTE